MYQHRDAAGDAAVAAVACPVVVGGMCALLRGRYLTGSHTTRQTQTADRQFNIDRRRATIIHQLPISSYNINASYVSLLYMHASYDVYLDSSIANAQQINNGVFVGVHFVHC